MGKKSLESLTETMFYVLMAFRRQALCGTEVADFVSGMTDRYAIRVYEGLKIPRSWRRR